MRTVGFVASVGLLLFFGLSALQGSVDDWGMVETLGQRFANLGQLLYGVSGLAAGIGGLMKRAWTGVAALVFAVSAGATAGLASVYWGGAGLLTGLASGGLGLLIGYLLYLGVRGVGKPASQEVLPVGDPESSRPVE